MSYQTWTRIFVLLVNWKAEHYQHGKNSSLLQQVVTGTTPKAITQQILTSPKQEKSSTVSRSMVHPIALTSWCVPGSHSKASKAGQYVASIDVKTRKGPQTIASTNAQATHDQINRSLLANIRLSHQLIHLRPRESHPSQCQLLHQLLHITHRHTYASADQNPRNELYRTSATRWQ